MKAKLELLEKEFDRLHPLDKLNSKRRSSSSGRATMLPGPPPTSQVESACWENQINAMDRGWPRWDAQWRVLCMACGRTMLQASARDWGE